MQTCAFFKTFHVGLSIQYGCVEQHLVRKIRRLWVVVERVECGCNADNSAVTNWQWLLHKFGLCTLFLKSFLALKRAFGQHKWFFNKTEPFFFYWAVSHSPYQTFFHFSSPRWIRLPQEKKKVPEILQEIISFLIAFLERVQFQPSFGETVPNCCQSWGLDASTWLIPLQKPLYFVFLWTSVTATVFQVGWLMSFLTISIWTCSNV